MIATIVGILFCVVCALLIMIILLQRGRGGGLSGAFGGAGGQTPFGAKTGDVFTWITIVMTAVFLVLTVMLNYLFVPDVYPGAGAEPPPVTTPAGNQQPSGPGVKPSTPAQQGEAPAGDAAEQD